MSPCFTAKKRKLSSTESRLEDLPPPAAELPIAVESASTSSSSQCEIESTCENDLGKWVDRSALMSTSQKLEMLKCPWVPTQSYDFKEYAIELKRKFSHSWLQTYAPWLIYSKQKKGALCLYCVLFPPKNVQGVLGSFIMKPLTRYKDVHEYCRSHACSQWHKGSTEAAHTFMTNVPVNVMMISGHKCIVEQNRKVLYSIISVIIFCGTHDLPFRGKDESCSTPGDYTLTSTVFWVA